jgi:hypothetical protein
VRIPTLYKAIKKAETILSQSLGGSVEIKGYTSPSYDLIKKVRLIDTAKFRNELRYSDEELTQRISIPGFYCLVVYLNGKPIGFDYGYNDSDDGVFFSDSAATLIERKGVGRLLGILELLYLYENGYSALKFTTEKMDESGRPLQQIWEKQGYKTVTVYPDGNVDMALEINPSVVSDRVQSNLH